MTDEIVELKERIEELEEQVEELEQSNDSLSCENTALDIENDRLLESEVNKEEFAKSAFDKGVLVGAKYKDDKTKALKEWLNYKIEARI